MNLTFNSFSSVASETSSLLKDSRLYSLTAGQKKIGLLVAVIFASFIAIYYAGNFFFNKKSKAVIKPTIDVDTNNLVHVSKELQNKISKALLQQYDGLCDSYKNFPAACSIENSQTLNLDDLGVSVEIKMEKTKKTHRRDSYVNAATVRILPEYDQVLSAVVAFFKNQGSPRAGIGTKKSFFATIEINGKNLIL